MKKDYDIIIVGGGPAGVATALYGKRLGFKILLIDKKKFPREKTCGDALSTYSIKRLEELNLLKKLHTIPSIKINHITFSAPNKKIVKLKTTPPGYEGEICGYVSKRFDFDNMLLQAAKEQVEVLEESKVEELILNGSQISGVIIKNKDNTKSEVTANIVVGADGYNSTVAKKAGVFDNDSDHWMVSVRGYYKGVTGISNAIEMHYTKDVIPGYFWIFPSPYDSANVGVCLPKKYVVKKKINLNNLMQKIINSSSFKERFKNAEPIGKVTGWTLPVGTKKRKIHGNGYILVGDAAGLVDPFSGEGIGNALTSGKFAAECIKDIFSKEDFSAEAINIYPDKLWAKMSSEFSLSHKLIQLTRYPSLINFVINRAIKSEFVANWLSGVVAETIPRDELTSIGTYFKLLFK